MSLSNWVTMAFDTHGKPCDGSISSQNGTSVEIYKNFLQIGFPKYSKTEEATPPCEPTYAQMYKGHIEIGSITIHASRYQQQDAIFTFVNDQHDMDNRKIMCGIGCSETLNSFEWLKKYHAQEYAKIPQKCLQENNWSITQNPPKIIIGKEPGTTKCIKDNSFDQLKYTKLHFTQFDLSVNAPHQSIVLDEFEILLNCSLPSHDISVGIEPDLFEAFKQWLVTLDEKEDLNIGKEYIEKLKYQDAIRFNQGDAFFAEHYGTPIPAQKATLETDTPYTLQSNNPSPLLLTEENITSAQQKLIKILKLRKTQLTSHHK